MRRRKRESWILVIGMIMHFVWWVCWKIVREYFRKKVTLSAHPAATQFPFNFPSKVTQYNASPAHRTCTRNMPSNVRANVFLLECPRKVQICDLRPATCDLRLATFLRFCVPAQSLWSVCCPFHRSRQHAPPSIPPSHETEIRTHFAQNKSGRKFYRIRCTATNLQICEVGRKFKFATCDLRPATDPSSASQRPRFRRRKSQVAGRRFGLCGDTLFAHRSVDGRWRWRPWWSSVPIQQHNNQQQQHSNGVATMATVTTRIKWKRWQRWQSREQGQRRWLRQQE